MVARHTKRPLRFVCFTDDPTGVGHGIEIKPMPSFTLPEIMRHHPFRRMFIFQERLEDLTGRVLHLDLDLLVTGSIDELFDYKPQHPFCVAENWTQIGLPCLQPLASLAALTLWAVPVAATAVSDRRVPARRVLTTRNVATEGRRAAALDRAHHLQLGMTEAALVGMTPSRTVVAEDIRDLQCRTGHVCRSTRPAPCLAWA
jgi:hypothetical protein